MAVVSVKVKTRLLQRSSARHERPTGQIFVVLHSPCNLLFCAFFQRSPEWLHFHNLQASERVMTKRVLATAVQFHARPNGCTHTNHHDDKYDYRTWHCRRRGCRRRGCRFPRRGCSLDQYCVTNVSSVERLRLRRFRDWSKADEFPKCVRRIEGVKSNMAVLIKTPLIGGISECILVVLCPSRANNKMNCCLWLDESYVRRRVARPWVTGTCRSNSWRVCTKRKPRNRFCHARPVVCGAGAASHGHDPKKPSQPRA